MNGDLTAHSICNMMAKAIHHVNPDDLAFLFATGKNELYLRDHLAAFMNKHLGLEGEEFISREWKKHDLTVNNGHGLHAIIEGKSYIHYDAANPTHLEKGKKSIKRDIERDLGKSSETLLRKSKCSSDCKRFFTAIMFTVEIDPTFDESFGHVTYSKYHRQGGTRFKGYDKLVDVGRKNLSRLLGEYGEVSSVYFPSGSYKGMKVHVDFYAVENLGD